MSKIVGNVVIPATVTPEMIEKWKAEYGDKKIRVATLLDEYEQPIRKVIIRVPDRKVCDQWEKFISNDPGKAKEIIVRACLLTDKDDVLMDDELFFSAYRAIEGLIPLRKAIVEIL